MNGKIWTSIIIYNVYSIHLSIHLSIHPLTTFITVDACVIFVITERSVDISPPRPFTCYHRILHSKTIHIGQVHISRRFRRFTSAQKSKRFKQNTIGTWYWSSDVACWLNILTRSEFQVQYPEFVYMYDSPVTYPVCRQKTWASKLDQPLPQIVPSLPSTDRTTIPPPFAWLSAREKRTPRYRNVHCCILILLSLTFILQFDVTSTRLMYWMSKHRLFRIHSKCND